MDTEKLREAVLSRLKAVPYPGFSRDIVSFGMVRDVAVDDEGRVRITIVYSAEPDRVRQTIEQAVVQAVQGVVGVRQVEVVATQREMARPSVPQRQSVPGVRHVIAVASAKGGVGKSTVAVNLAYALKELSYTVGLLDADIYGPSAPIMLKTEGEPTTDGKRIFPVSAMGLKMISIGFFLPTEDQALIWRGPMVMKAVHQLVWDVEWAPLDYLVVDLPPGTGDAQLTLLQEVRLSGAVIVTTPQRVALVDARKGVTMFKRLDTPVLGIVENMSYFRCSKCGETYEIFDRRGGLHAAKMLGVPFLGEIPIEPRMREGADRGEPVFLCAPDSEAARAFMDIARKVAAALPTAEPTQ